MFFYINHGEFLHVNWPFDPTLEASISEWCDGMQPEVVNDWDQGVCASMSHLY
jgi:hypothetical protein